MDKGCAGLERPPTNRITQGVSSKGLAAPIRSEIEERGGFTEQVRKIFSGKPLEKQKRPAVHSQGEGRSEAETLLDEIKALKEDNDRLRAEVERLTCELMEANASYSLMKYRVFEAEQSSKRMELATGALVNENRWLKEEIRSLRSELAALRGETGPDKPEKRTLSIFAKWGERGERSD